MKMDGFQNSMSLELLAHELMLTPEVGIELYDLAEALDAVRQFNIHGRKRRLDPNPRR